jgi:hypothetical protein
VQVCQAASGFCCLLFAATSKPYGLAKFGQIWQGNYLAVHTGVAANLLQQHPTCMCNIDSSICMYKRVPQNTSAQRCWLTSRSSAIHNKGQLHTHLTQLRSYGCVEPPATYLEQPQTPACRLTPAKMTTPSNLGEHKYFSSSVEYSTSEGSGA